MRQSFLSVFLMALPLASAFAEELQLQRWALREVQLMALVKADQIGQRLRLGKTLRADALMVLSFERQGDQRLLRVVVCDSKLGVRLWRGGFAHSDESDVTQLVEHCVTTVGEVRQRFAGDIRHIIAVPARMLTRASVSACRLTSCPTNTGTCKSALQLTTD